MAADRETGGHAQMAGCLAGGGEAGAAMRAKAWASTPLGSVDQWSTSLKSAVSFCLGTPLPVLIWWGEQRITLHNDAARPLVTSDTHRCVLGESGAACASPLWRTVAPAIERVMACNKSVRLTEQCLVLGDAKDRAGRSAREVSFTCSPLYDNQNEVGGVLCVVAEALDSHAAGVVQHQEPQTADRTSIEAAQQRLVDRLEAERALMTQIIDQMPAGVLIVEAPSGKRLYSNPQVEAITGRGEDPDVRPLDRKDFAAAHPDGRPYTADQWPLARALHEGENIVNEPMEFAMPDGEWRTISVNAAPVYDDSGRTVAAVTTFHDITEHQRAATNARFLAEASETLASALDCEATLRNVAELAVPRLADWCMVHMRDAAGKLRQLTVAHSDPDRQAHLYRLLNQHPIQSSAPRGVAAALRTGEPEWVPNMSEAFLAQVAEDDSHMQRLRALGVRSYMSIPLKVRGTAAGTITFVSAESGRRYSEDDLYLAEELAHLAGLEMDNARLYRDAQRELAERKRAEQQLQARLAQQAVVSELGQQALAGGPLQPLLDQTVQKVADTLRTELAKVVQLLPESEQLLLRAGVGWREGMVGHATFDRRGNNQLNYTLRSERPVIVEDLQRETRFTGPQVLWDHGVVSGMSVAIPGEKGRAWGALGVHSVHRHHFTADDAHFLQAVANVLAVAIQRHAWERTLHASEQRERARADELAAIMEAVPALVLIAHDSRAQRITGNRQAYKFLGLPRGANISKSQPNSAASLPFKVQIGQREVAPQDLPVQRAARGEEVREYEETVTFEDGTQSHLFGHAVPLHNDRGEPRGAVAAFLDVTEQRRLMAQLKQLNTTLEQRVAARTAEAEQRAAQLRALASQLTQAEQSERRRLAQTLHDHLQQLLVGVKMQLAMLKTVDPEALPRAVSEASALVDEAIESSRSLSHELSPPILYDAGLGAALHWLVPRARSKYDLAVEVEIAEDAEPEVEEVKVFLFQAVRELLLNVVKHAGTKAARVTMNRVGEEVCVSVRDQGTGFDPALIDDDHEAEHFGLFGIRERLEAMGGRMEMASTPGAGTTVRLYAPRHVQVRTEGGPGPDHSNRPRPEITRDMANQPIEQEKEDDIQRIRVLLVDDHEVVRSGLRTMLEQQPDISIIAEADDGEAAVTLAQQHQPDVVVMDVTMPRLNGIEATRRIHEQMPDMRVIGLSMHEREAMAEAMLEAGATAYLPKGGPAEDLITAIRGDTVGER